MEFLDNVVSLARAAWLVVPNSDGMKRSVGLQVAANARKRPYQTAILDERQTLSWLEFEERSNQVAYALRELGIGSGDVVALSMLNRAEYLTHVVGIVKLGAIAALVNTAQRGVVLTGSLALVKPKLMLLGEEQLESLAGEDAKNLTPLGIGFVADGTDGSACPAWCFDFDVRVERAPKAALPETAQIVHEQPCYYIYTSGTTGLPKASVMTHRRWLKAAGGFGQAALRFSHHDRIYVCLPLYHNNAGTVCFASMVSGCGSMALRRKFSASSFWDDIDRYQCTCFAYIGELCRYLLLQPERGDDASHGVTKIIGNGLRPELWMRFKQRFGIERIMEFYAASESNNIFMNLGNLDQTVGYSPGPWKLVQYDIDHDMIVRDARGFAKPVPDGQAGLLVTEITDRWKLDGYTDTQSTEKKILRNLFKKGDAWFNSGDLLRVVPHGWWPPLRHAQFVDRVGDTFRWKGENVSTTEVEEIVASFAGVQECTVYGVQVPGADGRAGMAMLVLDNEPSFDWTAFASHMANSLPSYARPLFVRVGGEIETTGTFKYRKVDLRDAGFDPAKAGRVRILHEGTYKTLTQKHFAAIASGAERVG